MLPQHPTAVASLVLAAITTILAGTHPPSITSQPRPNVYFKHEETKTTQVELPCSAEGEPRPEYRWEKDGLELDVSLHEHIEQVAGMGTLVIHDPTDDDEGYYQCFAYNSHGSTSVSIKSRLLRAVQETFPSNKQPIRHTPMVGYPLTLRCDPPSSIPEASVMWATTEASSASDDGLAMITYDDRLTKDLSGNLHITNVKKSDDMEGRAYLCMTHNTFLRSMVQGAEHIIIPQESSDSSNEVPVDSMWTSPSKILGLQHEDVHIKCIFSGNPTPDVSWQKVGGELPKDRNVIESFGQELVLKKVQFEDEGQYVCSGTNKATRKPITRKFDLSIKAKPEWIDEPEDQIKGVEEEAVFFCNAGGVPNPKITWYINGKPVSDAPKNDRRYTMKRRIEYKNLTKADAQVIQCNASNIYGYLWADVFLNVLAEPPVIVEKPQKWQKVAQGRPVNLMCRTTGKPDPKITWFKGEQLLSGRRYKMLKDGTLHMKEAEINDAGIYRCEAWNKFGQDEEEAELVVRIKTEIVNLPPPDREADAGHDIVMRCDSKTDPEELDNLKIEWLLEGRAIDTSDSRYIVSQNNFSLTIRGVRTEDTGRYMCNISNGLDSDTATTRLIVKSNPDPPSDVAAIVCRERSAEITWKNGSENNAPIKKYIVEYNTTFDVDDWQVGAEEGPSRRKAKVRLSPWANYTFRVIAKNEKGPSEPSSLSPRCVTPPALPDKHPANVHTIRDIPKKLRIRWDKMPQIDHNGEGFQYVVTVRRKNDDEAKPETYVIEDYTQTALDINTDQIYEPYEIEVRAKNSKGEALAPVETHIGHSGEAVPLAKITDFELDESKDITPTQASFVWTAVENDPNLIRGKFKGYKIQYWTTDEREDTQVEVDVPRVDFSSARSKRRTKRESHTISDFPPYTNLTIQVVVANTYYVGPDSNRVYHETPEGVPSAVAYLRASVRGSNHFSLSWGEPKHKNGILTGYDLSFQEVNTRTLLEMVDLDPQINDPEQRHADLSGLNENTDYRVYIWGKTRKGRGKEYYIDLRTAEGIMPAEPVFEFDIISSDMFNISWAGMPETNKPMGYHHRVEYRKSGEGGWTETPKLLGRQRWQNISGLEPGTKYEVKVIATNGHGETESDISLVSTLVDRESASTASLARAGWFIGMMVTIAILILILIIVCIIKRNRGDKYHVQEKERLRGRDPENGDQDHFNDGDDNSLGKSRGSLDNGPEKAPMESDTDSMEEYAGVDPSKFNEDGSFIGQYGTKTQPTDPSSAQPSMSTFV